MTAIAIWRNDEDTGNPSLWAAADSRVSEKGGKILIDDAVKILSLPIICRRPGSDGFFKEPYFVHTLGYCFAGSTLMGQNAYLGLSMLLSNLGSATSYVPSIDDIACQILAYLTATFRDYSAVAAQQSLFEVALFGYCRVAQRLEIFVFSPEKVHGMYKFRKIPFQNLQKHDFVYLGNERSLVVNKISDNISGGSEDDYRVARAPRFVIQEFIASSESPAIGGDLQIAIADRFGLRPFALAKRRELGEPTAYFSYLGRELTDDLTTVGEARVSPIALE